MYPPQTVFFSSETMNGEKIQILEHRILSSFHWRWCHCRYFMSKGMLILCLSHGLWEVRKFSDDLSAP